MAGVASKVDGLRILSLNGGDLNCISQLKILEEFMTRVEHDSDTPETRPCGYFHSITGVGASGVIAILLGVLGLSIEETSTAFLRICDAVSLGEELEPRTRSGKLIAATKSLLQEIGVPEEAKLHEDLTRGEGCKVIIPYVSAVDIAHCRVLKSGGSSHSIVDAICIAWAIPGLFSSVQFGSQLMREELISAVHGFNNPTLQAIKEAYAAFGKDRRVACLLSIGSGKSPIRSLSVDERRLAEISAKDTEA